MQKSNIILILIIIFSIFYISSCNKNEFILREITVEDIFDISEEIRFGDVFKIEQQIESQEKVDIDEILKNVPEGIQKGVFEEPDKYIIPLVKFLTGGVDNDFLKVKIFHDWLAYNIKYDTSTYYEGSYKIKYADWDATLKRGKTICLGYSNLLKKMCEIIGIECVTIEGYGRGYSFNPAAKENLSKANHAWNAIKIYDDWYLIDVTWDTVKERKGKFIKNYSTNYLFLKPEEFIYTHFPKDVEWQLLEKPILEEEFLTFPYLIGRFFQYDMKIASPITKVNKIENSIEFEIFAPDSVLVLTRLESIDGKKYDYRTFSQRDNDKIKIYVTFPDKGYWILKIFCKYISEDGDLKWCASIGFNSTSGNQLQFPIPFEHFLTMNCFIYSPLYSPLHSGEKAHFKLRIDNAYKIKVRINGVWRDTFIRNYEDKNILELYLDVHSTETGNIDIFAMKEKSDNLYWGLLRYKSKRFKAK